MTVNTAELLKVVSQLAQKENLRVAVKETLKGGLMAGSSAVLGGLMAGPVGIAIGGTLGSVFAAAFAADKFVPVPEILAGLPESQKEELVMRLRKAFENVSVTDAISLALLLNGNADVKARVLCALTEYLRNDLRMNIVD